MWLQVFPDHPEESKIVFIASENILVIVSLVVDVIDIIREEFHFSTQSDRPGLTEV